ncbi:hypothetical protein IQ07DRAFT_41803 [Pyrenochaeta sp. DS3sAY3a]|nr:hypothetical protein IQ07DRAFT_41803 [Pyrenochaeta sp. DS3sAY3a]
MPSLLRVLWSKSRMLYMAIDLERMIKSARRGFFITPFIVLMSIFRHKEAAKKGWKPSAVMLCSETITTWGSSCKSD